MVETPRPGTNPAPSAPAPPPAEKPRNKVLLYGGIGCLVLFVLGAALLCAGGWYVANNAERWATSAGANLGASLLTGLIEESKIPDDQKQRIVARIGELRDGFKEGEITGDQLTRVVEQLAQSPLFQVALVESFDATYIQPSAMDAQQKQDARRAMDRLARGVYEGSIPQEAVDEVLQPMMVTSSNGDQRMKDNPTLEELQQVIDNAKARADEAGVPDEPFQINYADEVDKAIERGLADPATLPQENGTGPAIDPDASFITPEPAAE